MSQLEATSRGGQVDSAMMIDTSGYNGGRCYFAIVHRYYCFPKITLSIQIFCTTTTLRSVIYIIIIITGDIFRTAEIRASQNFQLGWISYVTIDFRFLISENYSFLRLNVNTNRQFLFK